MPYEQINQHAGLTNFNTNNSVAFVQKTEKVLHEIKVGTEYIFKNLKTNLNKFKNDSSTTLSDSFKNDLTWHNGRIYGESVTTLTLGKKQLNVSLPIELNILSTRIFKLNGQITLTTNHTPPLRIH